MTAATRSRKGIGNPNPTPRRLKTEEDIDVKPAELKRLLVAHTPKRQLTRIWKKVLDKAEKGDMQAIKLVMQYAVDPEKAPAKQKLTVSTKPGEPAQPTGFSIEGLGDE